MEHIEIDGHKVDPDKVDQFFNADDGSRVSDEQWDDSKRRVMEFEALGDDYVSWVPIRDYDGKGEVLPALE